MFIATQIAFDHIVTINDFANLQHFLVSKLSYPALARNAHLGHDFVGFSRPYSMDILQGDNDTLVGRYIDAGDAGHSFAPFPGRSAGR
jgi:hypothetical protein